MKPRIPWPRIFAEGVAIVVSILLAFGIQAWWEGRQQSARTEALLAALETEWSNELPKLDSIIQQLEGTHRAFVALVAAHRSPESITPDSAAVLLRGALWFVYKPAIGALNAVLATDLDQVPDTELRAAIAAWPSVLEDAGPTEAVLREIGVRDLRAEHARVAESLGQGWSEEYYEAWVPWGVPVEDLASAAIRDDQLAILFRHTSTVLFTYRQRLIDIRRTLAENLSLIRRR